MTLKYSSFHSDDKQQNIASGLEDKEKYLWLHFEVLQKEFM